MKGREHEAEGGNHGKSNTAWNSGMRCPVTDFENCIVSIVTVYVKASDGSEAMGVIGG